MCGEGSLIPLHCIYGLEETREYGEWRDDWKIEDASEGVHSLNQTDPRGEKRPSRAIDRPIERLQRLH